MRSYENKRPHQAFNITETDEIVETEFYEGIAPSQFFLEELDNPSKLKRSKTFKKTGILKLNDWKRNYQKWLDIGYVCGDTIEKVGLLREFSLSQFTYQTIEQYLAIEKEVQRNKRRYNQSYEGYFLNDDGTLNYQDMINTIDEIISTGALSINDLLDKYDHRARDINIQHAESQVYEAVKLQANKAIDVNNELNEELDESSGIPETFDGELPDLDW